LIEQFTGNLLFFSINTITYAKSLPGEKEGSQGTAYRHPALRNSESQNEEQ
jgi:hypothetical protein